MSEEEERCVGWDPVANLRCVLPSGHYGSHAGEMPAGKHDHPAHYGGAQNQYETIKVLAAWFGDATLPGVVAFALLNTIKYLSRAGKKSGETLLDDLKKARFYIDWAITFLEKKGG